MLAFFSRFQNHPGGFPSLNSGFISIDHPVNLPLKDKIDLTLTLVAYLFLLKLGNVTQCL